MKITRLLILLYHLSFISIVAQAQNDSRSVTKAVQVKDGNFSNVHSFFVSEIHGFAGLASFKVALIGYLQQSSGVKHVVLEIGHASAYLINRYMQNGDNTCIANPKMKSLCEGLRQLYKEHPFTIHGIDFERMEFVKATKYILADNAGTENSKLYKYINSIIDTADKIPSDAKGSEARAYFYNKAKAIFSQEKENLLPVIKTDFDLLKSIYENPASEQRMNKRNKSMYTNISELNNSIQEGFVCILGGSHHMLNSNQSLLSRYLRDSQRNIVLIKMLCRNCYNATYFNANIFTPFAHDPADSKSQTKELGDNFDAYYTENSYQLINEKDILKTEPKNKERISIYYALFKDQPQW